MKFAAVALVSGAVVQGAAASQVSGRSGAGIVPKLENVASDKKFFGPPFPADYPDDRQPAAGHDLKPEKRAATYPKLQGDSGSMDNDFVHDENNDGGDWEAQMAYDNARVRYTKEDQLSKAAHERLRKEAKEAEEAAKKHKDAKEAEEAAEEAEKAAEAKEKDAEKDADHLSDLAKKAAEEAKKHVEEIAKQNFTKEEIKKEVADSDKKVKAAEESFEKAEEALKGCQKNYDQAEAALKKAEEINDAYLKKQSEITGKKIEGVDAEDYTERLKAARAKVEAAKAKVKAVEAQEEALDAKEKSAEDDLKRQKKHEDEAEHDAEVAEKSEQEAKKDLEEAKQRLRNIRNPPPPKSGAMSAFPSVLAVSMVACLVYML